LAKHLKQKHLHITLIVLVMATTVSDEDLAQKYQKKTDKQHVLDNPDTYTGTMELTDYETFVYNELETSGPTIIPQQISIIPGLYKLFDEGVVNCRDQVVRLNQLLPNENVIPVTEIDISINPADGTITMTNNGNGIDVAKHPTENLWIPELIFGHLRTSTNYDKDQKKIVGGKNGFGFKLVLIWSTWGKVETVDHIRGLKYVQEFENNLNIIHPPTVTKCTGKKPYTSVSFRIDFARLKLQDVKFSTEMLALFKRRVYDIAAITDKSVKVKFNGTLLPVRTFQNYVDLYLPLDKDKEKIVCIKEDAKEMAIYGRWEYVVTLAPKQEFTQVSFVNGVFTAKGGKHVDYIIGQIVKKMVLYIKQKKKIDVKPGTIKEQLWLFLRCDIDNPSFDSQTKDYLTTSPANFGSVCEVSDKFIEKLAKTGVLSTACALTEVKEMKAVKKNDGTKSKSVRGIPKLVDANDAGGPRSEQCMLILCEGDSAKAGIISGLTALDRNTVGVYPLRGKLFNVRGETAKRVGEVKEINEVKQIMGLQAGKVYTAEEAKKHLRYGRIVFMTDQDLDGSHIKGLCINLFDSEWAALLEVPGFIGFMNTPIIKAQKGVKELLFYNDGEYDKWKADPLTNHSGWHIKYYKGLGTSTAKEFKEYFAHKKIVAFESTGAASRDAIDMAFNKKRANDRKTWLANYDRTLYLDTNLPQVTYEKFIAEELVHFSQKDCERSIPNGIDGLKTSQRKILYTCFKRKLTNEVKVAQLGGSVSEISRYHHGEQSLYGAIINMAQDYVGSNNINLLLPNGQFGTRLQGGNDAASERYICTQLNSLTRYIFPELDDPILTYLEDDGTPVEPLHYVPIIPLLLVNGSKGIGTGFSTDILSYNPLTIIDYLVERLQLTQDGATAAKLFQALPYYEHFGGEINKIVDDAASLTDKFLIKGKYVVVNDKQVRITELPIGTWTDDYKQFLEDLLDADKKGGAKDDSSEAVKKVTAAAPIIGLKDYVDMSTDTKIDFLLTFASNQQIAELDATPAGEHGCNALEKALKLYTTRSTSNMHAFDHNEKLVKYAKVHDIIESHMAVRLAFYEKRKAYQVAALQEEANVLANKARFISEILDNTLDLRRKASVEVNQLLKSKGYKESTSGGTNDSYAYLVEMPMNSVTKENVDKLLQKRDLKAQELTNLMALTETQLWLHELAALRTAYLQQKQKHQLKLVSPTEVVEKPKKKRKL
jgi:DNA topoisomerase-2